MPEDACWFFYGCNSVEIRALKLSLKNMLYRQSLVPKQDNRNVCRGPIEAAQVYFTDSSSTRMGVLFVFYSM
jgi:hypothetical protein